MSLMLVTEMWSVVKDSIISTVSTAIDFKGEFPY